MKYGISRHGPIKTFLTRGIFKNVFQPILYSNEDKLHYVFSRNLSDQIFFIEDKVQTEFFDSTIFWLCLNPKQLFETIFLPDEERIKRVPVLDGNIKIEGKKCLNITQGFVLWNLEQMLKNDNKYKSELGLSIEHFELLTHDSIMGRNDIVYFLNRYRKILESGKVDPRDCIFVYIWDICDVLIPNKDDLMRVMGKWDEDVLQKSMLTSLYIQLFADAKKISLNLIKK